MKTYSQAVDLSVSTIIRVFDQIALQTPEATAVIAADRNITFGELHAQPERPS